MFAVLSSRSVAANTQHGTEAGLRAEKIKLRLWGFLSNNTWVRTRLEAVPAPSPLAAGALLAKAQCCDGSSRPPTPSSTEGLFWDLGQAGRLPNKQMPAVPGRGQAGQATKHLALRCQGSSTTKTAGLSNMANTALPPGSSRLAPHPLRAHAYHPPFASAGSSGDTGAP